MKKADRQARAELRKTQATRNADLENVMQAFIAECRNSMTSDAWNRFFPEAERSAGETFHIVEFLVSALAQTQTEIAPKLRKCLDAVITERGIVRDDWDELRKLNYDSYWRQRYGYKS